MLMDLRSFSHTRTRKCKPFACDAGQGVQNRWYDEVGAIVVVVVVVVSEDGWAGGWLE